jgi:hypothetical protein
MTRRVKVYATTVETLTVLMWPVCDDMTTGRGERKELGWRSTPKSSNV